MPDPVGEKYQLAGFDARERGFNRLVEFIRTSSGYQATLRYESSRIITPEAPNPTEALKQLILLLQRDGYKQLRSQHRVIATVSISVHKNCGWNIRTARLSQQPEWLNS